MQNQKPKGSTFLKVTGILMIIGAAISIFGGIGVLALGGVSAGASASGLASLLFIVGAIVLIGGIIQLIAGIFGVKYCNVPEKATACIIMGIIVIVLSIISIIVNGVLANSGAGSGSNPFTYVTSLILPILYLIGAFRNKSSATQGYAAPAPQQGYQQAPQQNYQQPPQAFSNPAPVAPVEPQAAEQAEMAADAIADEAGAAADAIADEAAKDSEEN